MKISVFAANGSQLGKSWDIKTGTGAKNWHGLISRQMLSRAGGRLSIKCAVPIKDIHGYWTPDLFRPKMQLDWNIRFNCAAHRNFPFIVFFNQAQENKGCYYLDNLVDDTIVSAAMNQQSSEYDLCFEIAVLPETKEFSFHAGFQQIPWTDTPKLLRKNCTQKKAPHYPAAAWLPVYCTWYARHAALDIDYLDTNASLAAELGCGTFIVDDGWCIDETKRVTPETLPTWYDRIGDWQLSKKKLPGFKEHVAKAQKMGLKYLLWVSPFFVGIRSSLYKELTGKSDFMSKVHEGYRVFDPNNEKAAALSQERLLATMRDYKLDGLKIDFVDAVPQSPEQPRGRTVLRYMQTLTDEIKRHKKDALIEFRQYYATPLMSSLGTQFRAGDVPFDYLENIHRIAQIRVVLGDRVPVHADPVYWHTEESPLNVARHMIASLAGVPMLSMDLAALPKAQMSVVAHYLAFYLEHLETFINGEWEIKYGFDHLSFVSVSAKNERIIILLNAAAFEESAAGFKGELHVLNLSNASLCQKGLAFDCSGKLLKKAPAPCGGRWASQ
ncbi:MAG: hypothetical protein A2X49_13245 [Lentisphaerae bacterium GWF2_52_8]|nr:MAG: hypothetical protein A2X49_13245 [Lentisphaerae bacterium GWF2_52_8]